MEYPEDFLSQLWDTDVVGAIAIEQLTLQKINDRDAAVILDKYFNIHCDIVEVQETLVHEQRQVEYGTLFG